MLALLLFLLKTFILIMMVIVGVWFPRTVVMLLAQWYMVETWPLQVPWLIGLIVSLYFDVDSHEYMRTCAGQFFPSLFDDDEEYDGYDGDDGDDAEEVEYKRSIGVSPETRRDVEQIVHNIASAGDHSVLSVSRSEQGDPLLPRDALVAAIAQEEQGPAVKHGDESKTELPARTDGAMP